MKTKDELLNELSECVINMNEEEITDIVEEYLENGYPPMEGIEKGLIKGMSKVNELYDDEVYFVTDILLCSDVMYKGLAILKSQLVESEKEGEKTKIVMGVVQGDTHDIGKNLVKIMLDTAGFKIYDLGRNVPLDNFVEKVIETKAELLCMSTLMTTTMGGMKVVIEKLKEQNINVKVMIGGGAITQKYADLISADGYSSNAVEAVKLAQYLVSKSS